MILAFLLILLGVGTHLLLGRTMYRRGYRAGRRHQMQQAVAPSLLEIPEYLSREQRQMMWYINALTVQAWRRGQGYSQAHRSNAFQLDQARLQALALYAVDQAGPLAIPPHWTLQRTRECWMTIFMQAYQTK